MDALAQARRLFDNLMALGVKRLTALALVGFSVFALTGFAGFYLSRPTMETLYSGLDREDVIGIGTALREAGIGFDVSSAFRRAAASASFRLPTLTSRQLGFSRLC